MATKHVILKLVRLPSVSLANVLLKVVGVYSDRVREVIYLKDSAGNNLLDSEGNTLYYLGYI